MYKLTFNQRAKWEQWLNIAIMSTKITVSKSTGFTPFMLIYGREITLPEEIGVNNKIQVENYIKYVTKQGSKLFELYEQAYKNNCKSKELMEKRWNI